MTNGYADGMVKRLVDIDDDALDRARRVLGTGTMKDTVNKALHEVIDLDRRRRFLDRIVASDGLDLADDEVMDDAWR
jgi:Arc/MetJ family transcription regulator